MNQVVDDTSRPNAIPATPPRVAPRLVRALCLACLVIATGFLAWTGALRIHSTAPDFEYFYKGGAWLFNHGALDPGYDVTPQGQIVARDSLKWYLPFVSRMLTLIAWLPPRPAGWIWLTLNLVAMVATLRLLGRNLLGLPPQDWPVTQWLPFLLLTGFWRVEYWLNQVNDLTLLLVVASFVCWQRGRQHVAGLWLGIAALIKVTPLLLVLWFALKRQGRVVAAAIVTVLLAGPAADALIFGPADAADAYRAWFRNAVTDGSQRNLVLSQTEMDFRNQGMGAVVSRWLHPTNYALHYDNDPRFHTPAVVATMNVASLSRGTVAWIVTIAQGLSLLGLFWLARHPAGVIPLWRLRLEWALFVLAMLWFMPVMRAYHLIWALPAVSLLAAAVHHAGWLHKNLSHNQPNAGKRPAWRPVPQGSGIGFKWSLGATVCLLGLIPVQLVSTYAIRIMLDTTSSQSTLRWALPQAGGILLGTVLMLALPMVTMVLWLGRNPAALPDDCHAPPRLARAPGPVAGERGLPANGAKTHA